MAKYLCKTLTQIPSATRLLAPLRLLIHRRAQSTQPDVTSSPPIPEPDVTVQKIEDAIHGFIVRKSAPDWLPFVPGSSYWVPPKLGSYGVADLVDKLENKLTHEELMSFATSRGWPYFTSKNLKLQFGNILPTRKSCCLLPQGDGLLPIFSSKERLILMARRIKYTNMTEYAPMAFSLGMISQNELVEPESISLCFYIFGESCALPEFSP